MIAAIGEHRELGKNNKLLWNIPRDMQRFRKLTSGHAVIMGRKTFESIGHPLPNRTNIVVTRDKNYKPAGRSYICNSLEEALKIARKKENDEIFIIGGGEIYKQSISFADKLYLTIVKGSYEADVFFPDYSDFKKVTYKKKDHEGNFHFTFIDLER